MRRGRPATSPLELGYRVAIGLVHPGHGGGEQPEGVYDPVPAYHGIWLAGSERQGPKAQVNGHQATKERWSVASTFRRFVARAALPSPLPAARAYA